MWSFSRRFHASILWFSRSSDLNHNCASRLFELCCYSVSCSSSQIDSVCTDDLVALHERSINSRFWSRNDSENNRATWTVFDIEAKTLSGNLIKREIKTGGFLKRLPCSNGLSLYPTGQIHRGQFADELEFQIFSRPRSLDCACKCWCRRRWPLWFDLLERVVRLDEQQILDKPRESPRSQERFQHRRRSINQVHSIL